MGEILDINIYHLAVGFLILLLPIGIVTYFKIAIQKSIIIAAVRMVAQLLLIAFYLEWIFEMNNAFINSAWVLIMIVVGSSTAIKRIGLNFRYFLLPFLLSSFTSVLIIDTFFLGFVLRLDYVFDARYFIPITGMVLGNSMNHNIVGLSTYFGKLKSNSELYYFLLTNGGTQKRALLPFIGEALKKGLNPLIANMSVIGLISLPGMMTGQILGGSSPEVAIKYQILIMLAIFTGCTINMCLSILISNLYIFDSFGCLKKDIGNVKIKKGKH